MKIVPPLESLPGSPSGPCDMRVPEAEVMGLVCPDQDEEEEGATDSFSTPKVSLHKFLSLRTSFSLNPSSFLLPLPSTPSGYSPLKSWP